MCIRDRRRELIYEGFVNYRLNQGDSEAEAKAYADGQIDNYAARQMCIRDSIRVMW